MGGMWLTLTGSGMFIQLVYTAVRRVQVVSLIAGTHGPQRPIGSRVKGIRLMLTRAILLGGASAIILSVLGIAGCNREVRTHPPLDKRIENVESELRRLEKTQQEKSQITDHSARTNNVEY